MNFFLSDWLENLYDTGLVVPDVATLVDLGVLTATELLDHLVPLKLGPVYRVLVIERIKVWALSADVLERAHKLEFVFNHF